MNTENNAADNLSDVLHYTPRKRERDMYSTYNSINTNRAVVSTIFVVL